MDGAILATAKARETIAPSCIQVYLPQSMRRQEGGEKRLDNFHARLYTPRNLSPGVPMVSAIRRGSGASAPSSIILRLAGVLALSWAVLVPSGHAWSSARSDATSHVLIGMTPNQGFEVTCEDSVLSFEPVASDELGIVVFSVEERHSPLPSTVCVRTPGPPLITDAHTCAIEDSSAVLCWHTDRPASSRVEYGPTDSYGIVTTGGASLTLEHEVVIEPLESGTTYHYRMISVDAFGNQTVTEDRTLTTLPPRPRIVDLVVTDATPASFTVRWATTRPCDARVEFGIDETYGDTTSVDPTLDTEHEIIVDGLEPSTTYYFRAWSTDDLGRSVCSDGSSVTTAPQDMELLDVTVSDTTHSTAVITWRTTVPASSWVLYGLDQTYDSATGDDTLRTNHEVTLRDLAPGSTYHFQAASVSENGAVGQSGDLIFRTREAPLELGGLAVTELAETSFTVAWTTDRPADSQVEYGADESYGLATPVLPAMVVVHRVTVEDLLPRTTYHVRAVSRDSAGTRGVSEDIVVTTATPELSVFDVTVPETTAVSATVSWRTSNPTHCWVEYGPTISYGLSSAVNAHPTDEHAVVLANLAPRSEYHFRIHAEDEYGQTAVTDDGVFTTPGQENPGGLVVFAIVVADLGPSAATICWQTNAPATSIVEYGLTEACGQTALDSAPAVEHCVALGDLDPGTRYYYRVRSETPSGQSAASDVRTFVTPLGDTTPPATPQGLVAEATGTGISLAWQPNTDLDLAGYKLYRRLAEDVELVLIADLSPAETTYLDTDVVLGRRYEYALAAFDLAGNEGERSEPVSATAGLGAPGQLWIYPNPTSDAARIAFSPPCALEGSTATA